MYRPINGEKIMLFKLYNTLKSFEHQFVIAAESRLSIIGIGRMPRIELMNQICQQLSIHNCVAIF